VKAILLHAALLLALACAAAAQVNYDESLIPDYTLPDALTARDGSKIQTADQWRAVRRPEILELFRTHVFGRAPGPCAWPAASTTNGPTPTENSWPPRLPALSTNYSANPAWAPQSRPQSTTP